MPGIDGMPPMEDVGRCSRGDFLKGAGLVVLSGALLAACQRQPTKEVTVCRGPRITAAGNRRRYLLS